MGYKQLRLRLWVERWIREDVWKNDSTRLWIEPKNIWQELDVKKTEKDKKLVREPDELTTKKNANLYSLFY